MLCNQVINQQSRLYHILWWCYNNSSNSTAFVPVLPAAAQRTSCDNITPATQPGRRFDCGPGYEFNTFFNPAVPPSLMNCCKVSVVNVPSTYYLICPPLNQPFDSTASVLVQSI